MPDRSQQTDIRILSVSAENSRAESLLHDAAMVFAEDAQVFAADIELTSPSLSPGDAVRLFGKKLRAMAHDYAPRDVFAVVATCHEGNAHYPLGEEC